MHDPRRSRRRLTIRVLGLLGAAALVAPHVSCSGDAATASAGSGGAHTGSGGASSRSTSSSSSSSGTGGAHSSSGSTGGATGTGGAATGTGGAHDDGGAGGTGDASMQPSKVCLPWPLDPDAGVDAGPCPSDYSEVLADFMAENCPRGWEPSVIVSGPVPGAGVCCYGCEIQLCTSGS